MCPIHQIGADGMSPVDVAVIGAIGVVLIEQVILALPLDQAIRIVQPIGFRQK
jgi:hypothetical protein